MPKLKEMALNDKSDDFECRTEDMDLNAKLNI